jgi:5'-3' exonuclease
MYDDIDRLCRLMNVPILRAVGEADVLCAQLYRNGQVQAIMSEDSDILLYGGGHLIRKFGWTNEVELVVLNQVLQSLHLSYDQFVDVALLTGTDYTESIKGMGPVGVIEAIVHGAQLEQMVKPSDLKQYQEARQLIRMAGTKEKPQTIPPFNFRLYQVDQLTHWMSEMCHYRPITIIKHYDQLRTVYTPRTKIKIVLKGASPVGGLGDVVPASHEVTLKNTTHTSCIVTLKSKSP